MRGLKIAGLLLLAVGMVVTTGCQSRQTAKANFDALEAHNKRLKSENDELRNEFSQVRDQLEQERNKPQVVEAAPVAAAPKDDMAAIMSQLPPGVHVEKRGSASVIRIEGADVNFGSGKAGLSANGKATLDRVASLLSSGALAGRQVIVEGHTDTDPIRKTRNLYNDNYDLGRARAQSVMGYLASKGVDRSRMAIQSYGPDRPISTAKDKNRRVEVVVMAAPSY